MTSEEFDWIDDAFDDKKLAEDLEKAKGPKLAGLLLVIVLVVAVLLIGIAFFGIVGAMSTM